MVVKMFGYIRIFLIELTSFLLIKVSNGEVKYDILEMDAIGHDDVTIGSLFNINTRKTIATMNVGPDDFSTYDNQYTDLTFIMGDTFKQKSESLDVSVAVSAKFLFWSIGGWAKYLSKETETTKTTHVSVVYSSRTHWKLLHWNKLEEAAFKDIGNLSTHVVSKVEYGIRAVFDFEHSKFDKSSSRLSQGSLREVVNGFVAGKSPTGTQNRETFKCTFFSDLTTDAPEGPKTYEEAMKIYSDLPAMITPAVAKPKKFWLVPLAMLTSQLSKETTELGAGIINDMKEAVDKTNQKIAQVNEILSLKPAKKMQTLNRKLKAFKDMLEQYKSAFSNRMQKIIPEIRKGNLDEKAIKNILELRDESVFNHDIVQSWLDQRKREISILSHFFRQLPEKGIYTENPNLFGAQYQVILRFYFYKEQDQIINDMKKCYNNIIDNAFSKKCEKKNEKQKQETWLPKNKGKNKNTNVKEGNLYSVLYFFNGLAKHGQSGDVRVAVTDQLTPESEKFKFEVEVRKMAQTENITEHKLPENIFSGDEAPKWLLRFQAQVKDNPTVIVVHGHPYQPTTDPDRWDFRGIFELNRKSVVFSKDQQKNITVFIDFKRIIDYDSAKVFRRMYVSKRADKTGPQKWKIFEKDPIIKNRVRYENEGEPELGPELPQNPIWRVNIGTKDKIRILLLAL